MSASVPAVIPHMVVDEGFGNTYYLLDLGDGSALAVDPPRDLRAVLDVAARHGLRIRFAADTHLHADFLSGARQLAHGFGTTVLASAAGERAFEHRGLRDGDEVDLGGLRLTALATPGHTDEHVSFLLADGDRPVGVFTGGSLIVGSAARTDLFGADRTEALTRAQYRSLRRLAQLPAQTALWPTHGAGSFCSAPPGTERTSTIGAELAGNPLLRLDNEDNFVRSLLGALGTYPDYFRRLTEINRRGPVLLDVAATAQLASLPASQVRRLRAEGAAVVDVRPVRDYAAGHVRGAVSIPLRAQFATWLGWLVDESVVVIVRNDDQDPADIIWPAANIGIDTIAGELDGGVDGWGQAGGELGTTPLL
ncbi:MAG: MBL fold metallo-hydrolase, partial [Pseudonocardia sp.]|nr:MBL fold metallo-hydrolase [Pseudonocardia sp.]